MRAAEQEYCWFRALRGTLPEHPPDEQFRLVDRAHSPLMWGAFAKGYILVLSAQCALSHTGCMGAISRIVAQRPDPSLYYGPVAVYLKTLVQYPGRSGCGANFVCVVLVLQQRQVLLD
jgi:hypothetical protein